jgi:MFS family permease
MSVKGFKRTKLACYSACFTMASVFSLPPMLFVTFREMYGISYTLLGTLVLANFCTQLAIDLIFTFFSKHFNIAKTVRIMPLITSAGLLIYSLLPLLAPDHAYFGMLFGTIVFSVAAGLSEVLTSPVLAALPSDNPQRDMSLLHSLYGFGVLSVVVVSTILLKLFGNENWMFITMFWAALPAFASFLFMTAPIPDMNADHQTIKKSDGKKRTLGLALCVACIFFGACAEITMSSWVSGYMENALMIDKTLGDILGMAMFAVLLAMGRMFYAKFGKNIFKVLFLGMLGAAVCYFAVAFTESPVIGLTACVLTGLSTSMLWPGTLIMMEENVPGVGVAAYALMASSGDLGASVAPQLMGIVVDKVAVSTFAQKLALETGMSADQIGLKAGMLVSALFPLIGVFVLIFIIKFFNKNKAKKY